MKLWWITERPYPLNGLDRLTGWGTRLLKKFWKLKLVIKQINQVFFCSWPLTISPRSKLTLAWWGTRLFIPSNHHLYHSEYDHHNRHGHHPHPRHDCQVREEARLPAVSSAVLYEIFPFIMVIIVSFFFMIMNIFITRLITSSHDKNPRCLGRTWSSKVSDDPSHRFSQISQARFFPSQFQQSTGVSSEAGNLSSSFHNSFSQTFTTMQSHTNWQFYNFYNSHGDYSIMIRKWMSSSTLCGPWLSSSLIAFSQGEPWFPSNTFVDILKKPKWNQQQVKQHLRADDKRTNRRTSQDWRHPWRRGWGRRWWPELDGGGGKISNDDAWWQWCHARWTSRCTSRARWTSCPTGTW